MCNFNLVFYESICELNMKKLKKKTYFLWTYADGKFGAMMEVCIQNSGPVTLEIESPTSSISNDEKFNNTEDQSVS